MANLTFSLPQVYLTVTSWQSWAFVAMDETFTPELQAKYTDRFWSNFKAKNLHLFFLLCLSAKKLANDNILYVLYWCIFFLQSLQFFCIDLQCKDMCIKRAFYAPKNNRTIQHHIRPWLTKMLLIMHGGKSYSGHRLPHFHKIPPFYPSSDLLSRQRSAWKPQTVISFSFQGSEIDYHFDALQLTTAQAKLSYNYSFKF